MDMGERFLAILLWLFLCTACAVQAADNIRLDDAQPYKEEHTGGWIDWQAGMIYGVGKASLKRNGGSKLKAMRAAQAMARGNIIKLAGKIQLDDGHSIESWGGKQVATVLKAVIKDSEVSSELSNAGPDPHYRATRAAPINGVSGLTRELLPHLKEANWLELPAQVSTEEAVVDEDAPWVVLDARDLQGMEQIRPALFPKIISSSGEVIYQVSEINPAALMTRGMAEYLVADPASPSQTNENTTPGTSFDWLLTMLGIGTAEAEERRKRRRRGDFIVTRVEGSQGLAKTNLVVSDQDARKLKNSDASSSVLKNLRVVVMVSGSVGGVEGKLSPGFRFARHGH